MYQDIKWLFGKYRKRFIAFFLAIFLAISFIPVPSKAAEANGAYDGLIYYLLKQAFDWLQNEMLNKLHQFTQEQTDALNRNANNIFNEQKNWQWQNGSLNGRDINQTIDTISSQSKESTFNNSKDYLEYAQGNKSGRGVDAKKDPSAALNNFNQDHDVIQKFNENCDINVPQPIGKNIKECTPAQTEYTNYMLTGINPLPLFPKSTLNNPIGQQYEAEKKVSITRRTLVESAITEVTSKPTNDFFEYMSQQIVKPTPEEIASESEAAIARDTLVYLQMLTKLQLKIYQAQLTNQRLLATLVAQGEDRHMDQIRQLGKSIH